MDATVDSIELEMFPRAVWWRRRLAGGFLCSQQTANRRRHEAPDSVTT